MKKLLIILLTGSLIYLSGCKLGPAYKKSNFDLSQHYRFDSTASDTVLNLRWWEIFNDPVLDTLVRTALRQNKDVLIAAARISAAKATVGYNKADQLPTINMAAAGARGNFASTKLPATTSSFYAYPELFWELDFWGKYRSATDAARAQLAASHYGMRTIQIGLISMVVDTYFELLEYKSKLEISENTLLSRKAGLEILENRYKYGAVAEIDLNQSQVQWALAAAAVPTYERSIALTENTLNILLGNLPEPIKTGSDLIHQPTPPEIPAGLPSQLIERRPDIKEAEENYKAANEQIGVAVAMRLPSISLTGLLGLASDDLSTLTSNGLAWSAGASLLGPVFQFGKNKRRVDIATFEAQQALLSYENTVLQAFKEVEDALITIETIKKELKALEVRYHAAMNAENLSWQRYDKGVTSYLEVIDSQTQSFQAQLDYSQTRQDLLSAYAQLYKALGGGWLSPEEEDQSESATVK